jgi:NADH-quinone oxidoreductase subunit L
MTHAFFKACLFLCAGSVMHALHGDLDVFKMGGLKKAMPYTSRTFLVAALAISGFPGFSGFFEGHDPRGRVHERPHVAVADRRSPPA